MEANVSPDVDAFWSYALVIFVGLFVAYRQVTSRLEGIPEIWLVGDTWVLFLLYLLIPVGLFWVLDRTEAIRDTSLFAALIVGIGYERILSGSDTGLQAPGGLSQFWSPFLTYANRVSNKILNAARKSGLRQQRRLIAQIIADTGRYQALDALAKKVTPDTADLNQRLEEIETNADLGEGAKLEQKAEILYVEATASEEYLFEMKEKGIVTRRWYIWHGYHLGSKLTALAVLLLIAGPLVYVWPSVSQSKLQTEYALWRLGKPNASPMDRYRAEVRLAAIVDSDAAAAAQVFTRLSARMRAPVLAIEQIDQGLNILLEHRCSAARYGVDLTGLLVRALNTPNVDARSRLHRALGYLAEKHRDAGSLPESLKNWAPSDGDSVTDLQRRIDDWQVYWEELSTQGNVLPDCAISPNEKAPPAGGQPPQGTKS